MLVRRMHAATLIEDFRLRQKVSDDLEELVAPFGDAVQRLA